MVKSQTIIFLFHLMTNVLLFSLLHHNLYSTNKLSMFIKFNKVFWHYDIHVTNVPKNHYQEHTIIIFYEWQTFIVPVKCQKDQLQNLELSLLFQCLFTYFQNTVSTIVKQILLWNKYFCVDFFNQVNHNFKCQQKFPGRPRINWLLVHDIHTMLRPQI